MKKKGISPLIATVLLIGFTIVLAASIMLWWVGTTREFIDKEGASKAAQVRCTGGVSLDILSCGSNKVLIKNKGSEIITAIIARNAGGGGEVVTEEVDLDSGEEDKVDVSDCDVGVGNNLQVIPAILEEGVLVTCTNQLVESSCS